MKIVAFNGSPRGKKGNTQVVVEAFLAGAREAGAETECVQLVEKRIKPCNACVSCWVKTPGRCAQNDDMAPLLDKLLEADVAAFATPVYVHNVSGRMKDFMDRLIPLVDPRFAESDDGETWHVKRHERLPGLVAIASGAYPDDDLFEVLRVLFRRLAKSMHTDLVGEVYRSCGNLLRIEHPAVKPIVAGYTQRVSDAGAELAREGRLSDETIAGLERPLVPKAIYLQEANKMWDKLIARSAAKHGTA